MENIANTLNEKITNQSSNKLLQILECLAKERLPIQLQTLSTRVNMSQPTVLRYLKTLQKANYVYQESSTSRYALTWKICGLADNIMSNLSLRSITSPFINNLVNKLNLGVCLVIEQDYQCAYLDCLDPTPAFAQTLNRVGKLAPMHATGSGKLLLSQFTETRFQELLAKRGLEKFTENTITDETALRKELQTVRESKIGMDNQECEPGLRCVSPPLISYSGSYIAAISVFGNVTDIDNERITREIIPSLQQATTTISKRLGYDGAC